MNTLGIRNKTQVEKWGRWYKNGETHRFVQPVGKQYSYGKGLVELDELQLLEIGNKQIEIQLEILKKYKEIERSWRKESY